MEFWKGRQKENNEIQQNRKKRRILKQAFWGNKVEKTSKLKENSLLGPFTKQKHKNTKKNKKNLLHFGKNSPNFAIFCFIQVTLFHVCQAVIAENTGKRVFSAEHSF